MKHMNWPRWSAEEDAFLKDCSSSGRPIEEFQARYGRTSEAIRQRAHVLEIPAPRPAGSKQAHTALRQKKPPVDVNRRASILHLVDLKRAGHSPRFTELHIPPDAGPHGVRQMRPEPSRSGCSCAQGW